MNKKVKIMSISNRIFPLSAILTAMSVILFSCTPYKRYQFVEDLIWNTTYHVTYSGPACLADSITEVLHKLGKSLSIFDSESLVSRLNNADSCKADSHLIAVYRTSSIINRESGGMFDPTIAPLIQAWGFGKGHKASADTLRLDSLMSMTGFGKTSIEGDIIRKSNRAITFNFSSIAKGYGCDAVATMFRRNGVDNFLVEIGGEIYCKGVNPHNKKWNISIDAPRTDPKGVTHKSQLTIEVTDVGIATSGNYRNFHGSGKSAYGHTINPLSGRPAKNDMLSATIISPTAMEADGYATACMAMGFKSAKEMVTRLNLAAFFVLSDSTVWESDEFSRLNN